MMISLTSFLPLLVSHLGITQAAIYERQRALVRLGLLPKPSGRGRGSGAEATPQSVALIILSVIATDNLSDMDDRIAAFMDSKFDTWRKRKYCLLTKQTVLLHAVSEIIADPDLAKRLVSIDFRRRELEATIYWKQKVSRKLELSKFHLAGGPSHSSSIEITARLDGDAIRHVAAVLAAERTI